MSVKIPKPESPLEALMALQIRGNKLPPPRRNYQFNPGRKWKFDFAWLEMMVALEVEGGSWIGGRHTRATGFEKDAEKYNHAALDGWLLLRFTGGMIKRGEAILTLNQTLLEKGNVCR